MIINYKWPNNEYIIIEMKLYSGYLTFLMCNLFSSLFGIYMGNWNNKTEGKLLLNFIHH